MTLFRIDPLADPRWTDLLHRSPRASVFHARDWLEALHRSYGYVPLAFTASASAEPLRNALLFCRVSSWFTGRRLVSLPFSDHCDPLVDDPDELSRMFQAVTRLGRHETGRYVEIRPTAGNDARGLFKAEARFCLHVLDLRRPLDDIYRGLHRSCIQRAIKRAEREGVRCETGNAQSLLAEFYRLHTLTRRRHLAPIQPLAWFQCLGACFGDRLRIYAAIHSERVTAAILTLRSERTCVYKYGCSDPEFNRLGCTPLLFWNAIRDAHADGMTTFDLGRSDLDNPGLITFKDHLGAQRTPLTYFRFSPRVVREAQPAWSPRLARRTYALVPGRLREFLGTRLYRHFA